MPPTTPSQGKDRILLVEGFTFSCRDLLPRLESLGYRVVGQIKEASTVVTIVEELRPDLVILDASLANSADAIAIANSVRKASERPIVFIADSVSRERLVTSPDVPQFSYLSPSFDNRELHFVLDFFLTKHRAERRLRTAEARYEALSSSALDGIVTTSITGRITSWNRGAEIIFGYHESEILRQPLTLLLPTRFRRENLKMMARLRTTGADARAEHRVELLGRHKNGREFPLELALTPWSSPEGRFVTGIIRDISNQKRAQEQLRLQSTALEAASNTVIITNTKGVIEWVNPAFTETIGYTKDEAIGQNPRILSSGQQSPEYYAEMWGKLSSGKSWSGEFINRHKDGHLITEDVNITPVRNEEDVITHYVAIKQDTSKLKENIQNLEAAHRQLADKNRALDVALIEVRAASEAKAAFLATMSHEIRTPMNGFIGMASLLQNSSPLTLEQVDYIDTICSSGETLLTLINDILDFSKIESNHMDLESVPFNLRRNLEETLDTVAQPARDKFLDLALEIDPSVPAAIVGDSVRIRQVITNLVGNAIKFTAEGEVVVQVRADPQNGNRQRIYFSVSDSGIGIAGEKLDRLFKSFSQVDSSTTRVYGGTGLGLAISQRLVGLMGGEIKVSTEIGKGSRFYFDLDLPVAPTLDHETRDQISINLTGLKILIVDDNSTNRRIFSAQLAQANCRVVTCAGGAEALAWLDKNSAPDLIITDMLMPGMDGVTFSMKVRDWESARSPQRKLPLVMISSGGFHAKIPGADRADFAFTLTKPVRQQDLIETVGRACFVALKQRVATASNDTGQELIKTALNFPRRILLAEDNIVNRKVATAMLKRLGYSIDVAINGTEAVDACGKQRYDLVLMDVLMPEMDGLAATREIRRRFDYQPLIIAMTANAMEGDRETCIGAGMDDYVTKPIKIEKLQHVVSLPLRNPSISDSN